MNPSDCEELLRRFRPHLFQRDLRQYPLLPPRPENLISHIPLLPNISRPRFSVYLFPPPPFPVYGSGFMYMNDEQRNRRQQLFRDEFEEILRNKYRDEFGIEALISLMRQRGDFSL